MQKIIRVPENYYKKVVIWASNIANLRLLYRCVMFDVTLYEINLKSLRCILKKDLQLGHRPIILPIALWRINSFEGLEHKTCNTSQGMRFTRPLALSHL